MDLQSDNVSYLVCTIFILVDVYYEKYLISEKRVSLMTDFVTSVHII